MASPLGESVGIMGEAQPFWQVLLLGGLGTLALLLILGLIWQTVQKKQREAAARQRKSRQSQMASQQQVMIRR